MSAELTHDSFFEGKLRVTQTRDGYRFSIDAILLAGAVHPKPGETVLDVGAGCGIISLLLAFRHPDIHVTAVEMQSELAELAQMNVMENRMADRIDVLCADLCSFTSGHGAFDWVVSNPPYYRSRSGRTNTNHQRALARHEVLMNLDQLMACAKRMLKTGGRFAAIYSPERLVDLFTGMRHCGIEPKLLQTIHSNGQDGAKMVMVQGIKGGRPGMKVLTPLIVYGDDGQYTSAVQGVMSP